jgi:hypothetical protein
MSLTLSQLHSSLIRCVRLAWMVSRRRIIWLTLLFFPRPIGNVWAIVTLWMNWGRTWPTAINVLYLCTCSANERVKGEIESRHHSSTGRLFYIRREKCYGLMDSCTSVILYTITGRIVQTRKFPFSATHCRPLTSNIIPQPSCRLYILMRIIINYLSRRNFLFFILLRQAPVYTLYIYTRSYYR